MDGLDLLNFETTYRCYVAVAGFDDGPNAAFFYFFFWVWNVGF